MRCAWLWSGAHRLQQETNKACICKRYANTGFKNSRLRVQAAVLVMRTRGYWTGVAGVVVPVPGVVPVPASGVVAGGVVPVDGDTPGTGVLSEG